MANFNLISPRLQTQNHMASQEGYSSNLQTTLFRIFFVGISDQSNHNKWQETVYFESSEIQAKVTNFTHFNWISIIFNRKFLTIQSKKNIKSGETLKKSGNFPRESGKTNQKIKTKMSRQNNNHQSINYSVSFIQNKIENPWPSIQKSNKLNYSKILLTHHFPMLKRQFVCSINNTKLRHFHVGRNF